MTGIAKTIALDIPAKLQRRSDVFIQFGNAAGCARGEWTTAKYST